MAVSGTTNRVSFTGDGVSVVFGFPYYLRQNTDLKVLKVAASGAITVLVLNTDYTLAFIGATVYGVHPGGANITCLVAPTNTEKLVLYRDPPQTQLEHWTDNDPKPSSTDENSHDKAAILIQRLADLASRSVRLKDGFALTFDTSLPTVLTADYMLAVNPTADGFVVTPGIAGPTGPQGPAGSSGGSGAGVTVVAGSGALTGGSPIDRQYIAYDATGGAIASSLPQATLAMVGQVFDVKKIDSSANTVTITPFAGDQILTTSLVASLLLDYQGKAMTLICRAAGFWDVM